MSSRARISSAVFAAAASSSPSLRAPHLALAAATERARSGTLRPEDAHYLFDELLRQATAVPRRALNEFLSALARAPSSAACRDGPALAVALFNRASRADGPQVLSPTLCTYSILMDCCTRAHRPELTLAFFGQLLKTGLGVDIIIMSNLLKGLCEAKRTDEALDILLHRMTDLGCVPDAFSYCILLKSLCNNRIRV
jgi:pentatricopeptide repeat protein